jgi:hypothetical protein
MAKPHKFAWNGLDAETSLPIETVANMAQRAALESTGDLLKGKHRIVSVKSTDRAMEFRINDFLASFKKLMVFTLSFTERNGRVFASTSIDWYMTSQTTVGGFIPVGAKAMVAHHTLMQFVRNLASQVTAADPTARIVIREGAQAAGSSAPTADAQVAPSVTAPTRSAASPAVPPLPPPRLADHPAVPPPPPPARQVAVPPVPAPEPPPQTAAAVAFPSPPPAAAVPPRSSGGPLVTGIPGMPSAAPPASSPSSSSASAGVAAAPAPRAPVSNPLAAQMFAEDEDLESTRLNQSAGLARAWSVVFDDGRDVGIREVGVVVGRDPAPPSSHPAAEPFPVEDPYKSVSKTHAVLAVESGMLWITDLHSTNGTRVTNDVGEATLCPPGVPMPVGAGWAISMGEFTVRAKLGA